MMGSIYRSKGNHLILTGSAFLATIILLASFSIYHFNTVAGSPDEGQFENSPWSSFRGDTRNSGYRSVSIPLPEGHLSEILWDFDSGSVITSSVVAVPSEIIFGTADGILYCLDPESGEEKWNISLSAPLSSTPSVDPTGSSLYTGDDDGFMHRVDMATGEIIWSWNSTSDMEIKSSPALYQDFVIFGSYDSSIYCLHAGNGSLAWKNTGCGNWVHSTSPIYMDSSFFGSCDGTLNSINIHNGSTQWSFEDSFIPSSPAVMDGRLFFGSYDMNLYCLDASNGDLIWNTTLQGEIYSSPAVGPGTVAVGCNDGRLYLLDSGTGSILWSRLMGDDPLESSPILTDNSVIVTYEQGLAVLSVENGSSVHSFEYGECGESSPAIMGGRIYYGDRLGYVRCVSFSERYPQDNTTGSGNGPISIIAVIVVAFFIIIAAFSAAAVLWFFRWRTR